MRNSFTQEKFILCCCEKLINKPKVELIVTKFSDKVKQLDIYVIRGYKSLSQQALIRNLRYYTH